MADRIRIETESLSGIARSLSSMCDELLKAKSSLDGLSLSRINGAEVRFYMNYKLNNGASVSAENVRSAVQSLNGAVVRTSNDAQRLSKAVERCNQLCMDLENKLSGMTNVTTGEASGHSNDPGEGLQGICVGSLNMAAVNAARIDLADQSEKVVISKKDAKKARREAYDKCLQLRHDYAIDPEVALLYDKFKDRVKMMDDTSIVKPAYNYILNTLFYNWEDDFRDPRGVGTVYYHEVGHLIDDYSQKMGDISSSQAFSDALRDDFERYVQKIMDENSSEDYSCKPEFAYLLIALSNWGPDVDAKNGLSDLCGGLSFNKCRGKWGHPNKYWNKREKGLDIPDKVNNEAFAHFFVASMDTDPKKLDYLKEVFPTAYEEFKKLVNEIICTVP